MDAEASAQFTPVRPCLHRQPHKLPPLIINRHLPPRHGWPPKSQFHAILKCRLCPRTAVGYLPGLNIKSGHDIGGFQKSGLGDWGMGVVGSKWVVASEQTASWSGPVTPTPEVASSTR